MKKTNNWNNGIPDQSELELAKSKAHRAAYDLIEDWKSALKEKGRMPDFIEGGINV